jgi:hypothetical protein
VSLRGKAVLGEPEVAPDVERVVEFEQPVEAAETPMEMIGASGVGSLRRGVTTASRLRTAIAVRIGCRPPVRGAGQA